MFKKREGDSLKFRNLVLPDYDLNFSPSNKYYAP